MYYRPFCLFVFEKKTDCVTMVTALLQNEKNKHIICNISKLKLTSIVSVFKAVH